MAGRSPERSFTFMVVPEEGRGQVRQVTLSLTSLRRWLMLAVAIGALAALGLVMLATAVPRGLVVRDIMDENAAMKAQLQQMEVQLDQVEDALRRLRLVEATLQPRRDGPPADAPAPADAPEADPAEATEAVPADAPGQGGEELDGPPTGAGPPPDAALPAEDGAVEAGQDEETDGEEQSTALSPGVALAARVSDRLRATLLLLRVKLPAAMALAEAAQGGAGRDALLPDRWPVVGIVSSSFGWRRSPFNKRWKFHAGVDIAADQGDWVVAPGAGTVVHAGNMGGYGKLLQIDHGGGIHTRLAHNSVIYVSVGDVVKAGQKVASVGSTGHSTGPHCHLEVLIDGEQVDPTLLLP